MTNDNTLLNAEKKIQEALETGAKVLNLSGAQLMALPESLGRLTQIQSLILCENQLTVLPEWFGQFRQLQSLDLSNNKLAVLPKWLSQFTQMQSLDLSRNRLTAIPDWLGRLTQLRSLNLSRIVLTSSPDGRIVQIDPMQPMYKLEALPEWIAQLTQLESLDVSGHELRALPEWLDRLAQLRSLDIAGNRLTTLPASFMRLQKIERLNLFSNQFRALPGAIPRLGALNSLAIGNNPIDDLPSSLQQCGQLRALNLGDVAGGCPLRHLPEVIKHLRELETLYAYSCELSALPKWLGELKNLRELCLVQNRITDLPASLAQLERLTRLELGGNPLNPQLATANNEGIHSVKRYLREMAKGARSRYEAKLLILGDGNEGKTCVSRALRGLPFREQKTTHGVDVEQWKFAHPDDAADREKDIALNIWDFEGQEISHQTHQFFLTSHSLYLLVFKCRDQFLMDRAEYWLDTIRARAPKVKVAIVITQCEERSPHVPLDRLQAQYGDLLAKEWFFTVGCKNGLNITNLITFIQRSAANLEHMGSPWPTSYDKAEKAIKARKRTSHINRKNLHLIFSKAGVSEGSYEDAAGAMSRLGVITQFPDCPDLRDFVVLRPQWLTKAISKVMEDGKLSEDKGEINMKRMEGIWNKAGYRGMFTTFHNCMKEFELCYDLEDGSESCLIPLRFGYEQPAIPWCTGESRKERRVEYKLNIRPPMGIMSRFIVKTHHMIVTTPGHPKGIYWQNGVFLRTGEGSFCSEALCQFVAEERKLRIEVRAAFPQNMSEQIHAYIKAVFSFFGGLEAERSYGCIRVDPETQAEQPCSGLHTEKRIYSAISKQRGLMDCEFEEHEVDPQKLIWGFSSFNEFVMARVVSVAQFRQELDKQPAWAAPFLRGVGALLDWVNVNGSKMDQLLQAHSALSAEFKQEAELKLHEYLAYMSEMLDDRDHTAAPGLISITTKDRSPWNPVGYFKKTYVLTPFCECEGNLHASDDGRVEFTKDKEWWEKTAPWIARGTKLLAAGLQLGFAGMPLGLGAEAAEAIKDEVTFMEELTKHLELKLPEKNDVATADEVFGKTADKDLRGDNRDAALMRVALARLLEQTAPNNYEARRWGSLRRVRMSDNSYRWLCEDCAKRSR